MGISCRGVACFRLMLGFCLGHRDLRAPFEDFGSSVPYSSRSKILDDACDDLSSFKIGVPIENYGGFVFNQKNVRRRTIGKNRSAFSVSHNSVVINFAVFEADLLDESCAIENGVVEDVS